MNLEFLDDVNPIGGSGTKQDRDSACTPKWLADVIGEVDLDPCSNERSHIQARRRLILPEDGLDLEVEPNAIAFINPPYARGQVIKWVRHWATSRFIFLLRWDPRTRWFDALYPYVTHVWFPKETEEHPGRIEFEPPPGVTFSSNPFPHALYLRDPVFELLNRLEEHGRLLFPKL